MSGDGNDEEIVKLSIDGKVMIITTTMKMMMMAMAMTMTDNNDDKLSLTMLMIMMVSRYKRPLRERMETRQSLASKRRSGKSRPFEVNLLYHK